jgi:hypothetical protein
MHAILSLLAFPHSQTEELSNRSLSYHRSMSCRAVRVLPWGWIAPAAAGVLLVVLFGFSAAIARADVTYTERTQVKRAGAGGAEETTRTVRLAGVQEREESAVHYSLFSGKSAEERRREEVRIIRADLGSCWTIDSRARTYSESTFDALRSDARKTATAADSTTVTTEAPDANPLVEVRPTGEAKQVGPWKATLTVVRVSTQVVDLESGAPRKGEIIWELWLAQGVPGVSEIRSFNQLYSEKLGTTSEFASLASLGVSYPKSVKQAMLALKDVAGYPVEWTWTFRAEISPEAAAALRDAARTELEAGDTRDNTGEGATQTIEQDPHQMEAGHPIAWNYDETEHKSRDLASRTAADSAGEKGTLTGKGLMVLMKATSRIESIDTRKVDPSSFEIPQGYRKVPR